MKGYSCKLKADIPTDDFYQVLKNNKNWLEILSRAQYDFLKKNNILFENAIVYGTLIDKRIQWSDDTFGVITPDLIHQDKYEQNTFHEISIRYPSDSNPEMGQKFEDFIKRTGITFCDDQINWPVNKFDLLDILN
jgi:hypothetical protein